MITNINVDEKLLNEALALSDQSTVNLLIEAALCEYIQRRQQLKILELFGTIEYEENYNYKQQRQKI
ncbi:type II toxin-antitoxin system VapB family antitoxin [Okeania sp.]|uniref:type II toxin-antitoxin system VapB family antitoxin n=1 Tax=Okeania sp. TaxID=3100323 RepID=UPI002B4AC33C|nr:type II toxin-antitoxin system VapB family antitoxin [Okeania sp.]MEB3342796.1 type II toxin-antitoxin system VapB family antitoxin [Okeania sp.]